MGNRAQRLALVTALFAVVLFVRLVQLQVGQHAVWSGEAARLVRSGAVLPYRRGSILDVEGRVLARDREAYHIVLVYRDFRRGHPLGQVAHARSALEGRPVALAEALESLEDWALELVRLSVTDLDAFGDGAPLEVASYSLPAHPNPAQDLRAGRSSDLRFYIGSLLQLDALEWQALRKARRERGAQPSFATLVARWRGWDGPWEVEERLRARLDLALGHLDRLAGRLTLKGDRSGEGSTLGELVEFLERRRRSVEDATASRLFREAAGFWPGRVAPELLANYFDLDWIARRLRWDTARSAAWMRAAREEWLGTRRDGYALPHLLAEGRRQEAGAELLLNLLAAVFCVPAEFDAALDGRPRPWRRLGTPEVFARLEGLFEASLPEGYDPARDAILPLHDAELRERRPSEDDWGLLEAALGPLSPGGALAEASAEETLVGEREALWRRHARRAGWNSRETVLGLAVELADTWDDYLQVRLSEVLGAMVSGAEPDQLGSHGRLRFAEDRLERASERARFVLRDFGSREVVLDERPDYEVVHSLTRHADHYPGFAPRDTRERLLVRLEDEAATPGSLLLGRVSPLDADAVQAQRLLARRLEQLRAQPTRTLAEQEELASLVGEVDLREQVRGASGIEASLDTELRGKNGYLEHLGLEDVFGEGGRVDEVQRVVDGHDVRLTLDADLQRAVEEVLEHPVLPDHEEQRDEYWFANPVGAIVVLSVDGDVAAAASVPNHGSDVGGAVGARASIEERTLRIPDFQPPGSVFKPFVAAWAVDRLGIDPRETVDCVPPPDDAGHAGYGGVRCWRRYGHGSGVDLQAAIEGSCNAYFARLGERFSDAELYRMATHFGFGEPTGVRPPGVGAGLVEHALPRGFLEPPLTDFERRLAGNGLGIIEATPMQVARATVGLATGVLPTLRLIDTVGGRPWGTAPARPVELSPATLALVRRHLYGVTNSPDGTAYGALNEGILGLHVAAKTGSADLAGRSHAEAGGVIAKHTWVAGWFPHDSPEVVFVVFLSRARFTASHTAVHVARQLLERPELHQWLERKRVRGGGL